MPAILPSDALREAELAVLQAREARAVHRKRTAKGDPQREHDIKLAMERVRKAMRPLRSAIGKFPYGPQTQQAESNREKIRAASRDLQKERRKLWKLQHRPKEPTNDE